MTFPTEAEARAYLQHCGKYYTGASIVIIPTTHGCWTITSEKAAKLEPKICSICREPFREFPNNAQPVNGGGCCNYCDDHVVTPTRIKLMQEEA